MARLVSENTKTQASSLPEGKAGASIIQPCQRTPAIATAPHALTTNNAKNSGQADARDFEDVMRHPPYSHIIVDQKLSGSWKFGMCRTAIRPQSLDNVSAGYSALAFHRKPTRVKLEVMGAERAVRDYMPGEVVLRPSGLDWAIRYLRPAAVSTLALPTDTARDILGDPEADFEDAVASLNVQPFWSPLLSELVRKLDSEIFEASDASPLRVDSLYHAICWEIWSITQSQARQPAAPSGPVLCGRDLRNIDEYVDETNASKVDFEALSRLTDLPRCHIAEAFKRTVGQTPYQYILARRIKRARQLIETTDVPLSEIAYRCGFSSQSHLNDVFRNKIGATPKGLRKAFKG